MRVFSVSLICLIHLLSTQSMFVNHCGTCDADACEPPQNCLAGVVKDSCSCCYICGRREGERCDDEELNLQGFGKCGDNLRCQRRNDLHPDDPPESVCFCTRRNPLCGSDGVTYENICQLTEARYRRRDGLRAESNEPCVHHPEIIAAPRNVRNSTGASASMTCETKGWPVPTIQWLLQRHGNSIKLPGNNTHITVQNSGQDTEWADEETSWLLFRTLEKNDEGTYICKAENYIGFDTARATVSVF